jgi:hypothetical protein
MSFRYRLPGRDSDERGSQTPSFVGAEGTERSRQLIENKADRFFRTLKAVNLLKNNGLFDVKPSTH